MSNQYDASLIQVIGPAKNLYELIQQMRARPGMYLRTPSISAIENFTNGYSYVCHVKAIDENEQPPWGDFHEFVRKHTGFYESTSGWCGMILSVNNQDEEKALAMFFNLFEAFLASAESDGALN